MSEGEEGEGPGSTLSSPEHQSMADHFQGHNWKGAIKRLPEATTLVPMGGLRKPQERIIRVSQRKG